MAARAESLTDRIRSLAAQEGIPPIRLRNRIAFQRVLARLATSDRWMLKGGFVLELRLGTAARATKDLDLELRGARPRGPLDLQDLLDAALEAERDDGFDFAVRLPKAVRAEDAEPSTWRVVLDVRSAGRPFGTTTIDIVRPAVDFDPPAERLRVVPNLISEPFEVAAIDVHRHAAEKLHAYSRIYAHGRPSSRVKDLVDLVLLAGRGLVDPVALGTTTRQVFAQRATELPVALPHPPRDWAAPFAALAAETGAPTTDLDEGRRIAADLFDRSTTTTKDDRA